MVMDKQTFERILRALFVLFISLCLFFGIRYVWILFHPFVIALILTTLIHPIVSWIEKRLKQSRLFATMIVIGCLAFLFLLLIFLIITEMIDGTIYLAKTLPKSYQYFLFQFKEFFHHKVVPIYHKILTFVQNFNEQQQTKFDTYVDTIINRLLNTGSTFIEELFFNIPAFLSAIPYSLTMILLILLATFFLTKDWYDWQEKISQILSPAIQKWSHLIMEHFMRSLLAYLKAQFILVGITAGIVYCSLMFLKIKHALTITFFIALVDFIPLIGIGLIFIPWIFYLFAVKNYTLTISLSVLYMVIIVFRQLVEPRIISKQMGINPVIALIVFFLSFQFWGILGVISTPFILIFLRVLDQSGIFKRILEYIHDG